MADAKYVWFNERDASRNPYAAFRRTLVVSGGAVKAELSVFADTVYKLSVNGEFVGFGPVRFDPRYPQYDTYDLKPYLREGRNVVAILANFHGHKVFKSIPCQAAMIAWGSVETGAGPRTDLSTGKGGWKCVRHAAFDRYTPKLSFALFAQTHYDQSRFGDGWEGLGYDDSQWPEAVALADQGAFGELTPRDMPFMSLAEVRLTKKTRVFPVVADEDVHSFWIPLPSEYFVDNDPGWVPAFCKSVAWSTYIYSPKGQTVIAGGNIHETLYVNGAPAGGRMEDEIKPLRHNFALRLKEGWNHVFGSGQIGDVYNGYLGLPKGRGLVVSADKDMSGARPFRHTKVLPAAEAERFAAIKAPWAEDEDISSIGGWVYASKGDPAEDPCRESSWVTYGPTVEALDPEGVDGRVFPKALYPDGFTVAVELDHMMLLFPRLALKGADGAKVDIAYNDRYVRDGRHVRQQSWIPFADRLSCSGGAIDYEPVQPRGFRVMNITVRGASGDVTLERLTFRSAHYPVDKVGRFECSDPALNSIWEYCARTQAINMEDGYDDCVDRERGIYTLDVLVQYHNNLACFGDHKVMKRALELYAQSAYKDGMFRCVYPNTGRYTLPDFALYAVIGFADYHAQTGDAATVRAWWGELRTNLARFSALADEREDLLMNGDRPDRKNPDPADRRTGHLGDGGCSVSNGINCIYSSLYLIALRSASAMAKAIGEAGDAKEYDGRIAILERSIPEAFWSDEAGCFSDNTEMTHFSPHASLFAFRAGAVPEHRLAPMRKAVAKKLSPYFANGYDYKGGVGFTLSYGYYMFDTLYKAGMHEVAESCMREGWGYFLAQGLVTTPEHPNMSESQCHAWAASPVHVLSKHLLGVDFNALDGYDKVTIDVKPSTDRVEWVKGVYPHPWGGIEVEWHKEDGKVVFDKVAVPEGVTYRLA